MKQVSCLEPDQTTAMNNVSPLQGSVFCLKGTRSHEVGVT